MLARHQDPIAAIATAPGRGAVGIVRVSGRGLAAFVQGIRASDRVKDSVKEKGEQELLTHYGLAGEALKGGTLTRLGVLLVGTTAEAR